MIKPKRLNQYPGRDIPLQLWVMVRNWLRQQKHIRDRVQIEALEFGPPFAELCTVGNRYTWAMIYDDYVEFYTRIDAQIDDISPATRLEVVLTLHATDKEFFKKMKNQLWKMLYSGHLNWPMP
jgi:hypothetical protein